MAKPLTDPQVERLPLGSFSPDPANVRRHPERNKATIRASLRRFKAGRSLVADGNNVVRAGNGTFDELSAAGIDEALVVDPKPNQVVIVRRKDWSPSEATAYAIADNRSADQAEYDETALAETLRALQSEPDLDLDAVGFTAAEVDELCKGLGDAIVGEEVTDPQGEWEGMPECENGDETAYRSVNVHFGSQEAVDDFARLIGQEFTGAAKYIWHPRLKMQRPSATPYVDEP